MNKTHIHKLKRHSYPNGTKVYFCVNDCNYKVEVPLALGKTALCWICGEPFVMNEYSIKLAKPHCGKCGKIQIKDSEGNRRFISKNRPQEAIADMGHSAVQSLKERLGQVVTMEKDEDI